MDLDYEQGLEELKQLCRGTAWEEDFQIYELRLRKNQREEQLFGSDSYLQTARNRILSDLNRLANERYKISFNDLCWNRDNLVNVYIDGADALFREGHYPEAPREAFKMYERAIRISPRNFLLYQRMSDRLLDLSQWNDVINRCNDAISLIGHAEESSIVARIYANKGQALFKLRQFEDALTAFNTAIEKHSGSAELWQPIIAQIYEEKVQELLKANKLQEAHSVLDKAIQVQPNNFKFLWDKGIIYTKQGNIEGTRNSYREAINLKSDNAFLHKAYGDALLNLHKAFKDALLKLNLLEEAFEAYSQAIARKPDFDNAYKRRSEVCKFIAQIWLQKAKEDEERF